MRLLFISDLHLDPERGAGIELFRGFLQRYARRCDGLYILGDFLEYWLGDDDDAAALAPALHDLHEVAVEVCPVYLMHGNRDFLIGQEFARRYSLRLIDDPSRIDIDRQSVLLMHGDTLCTDDTAYQAFRSMVRADAWQQAFLGKPLAARRAQVRQLRASSREATSNKSAQIMDVNPTAVTETLRKQAVRTLIHGHTHRPAIHASQDDQGPYRRLVLGDWYQGGSFIAADDAVLTLYDLTSDGQARTRASCRLGA